MDLEKTGAGPGAGWGGPTLRCAPTGSEELLRQLSEARIIEFPAAAPKDLRAAGLAPQAKTEVTLVTPQGAESLFLGAGTGSEVYARLGPQGQVVKVGKDLPEQIARAAATLEDRRLWSGSVTEVGKVVWGAPGKTWTAVREPNFWKITGPDQAEAQASRHALADGPH